ncbi:type III pantothenate kinase [Flavihumibacter petaseus]|uniref:Type III pantothenate kinase n=1 Tax=Flavihumibacter petaseus NBRC 106054 TaxID=1220578 RepID=A0A0E9MXC7_9BACT|nr:type III pantothenate kinase [Flavihumibacter petaseus]GAO42071.1 type III pantothenate kinase [Flavihumibacter petaseus NBRC 106054]
MATTLCLDFGNTRQKFAFFDDNRLETTGVLPDTSVTSVKALLEQLQPDRTILSSVINHDPAMIGLLEQNTRFHLLSHKSKLPFTTPVGKPATIGADRLALCAAVVDLFPGKNNLAIALGTCITYNFVNSRHEFLGGGISPGMDMRFRSLKDYTAKLPLVDEDWNFPLIGYDTVTNITSGVILGMAKEIDGFIDAYAERYGNFNVVLTGGNSAYFVPHLKNRIFADQDLIFKGLYAISACN